MAPVTDSPPDPKLELGVSAGLSLTQRILVVNILAVLLLAGSFFYLDGVRSRLIEERIDQAEREVNILALNLASTPTESRNEMLVALSKAAESRLRIYDPQGKMVADSQALGGPAFALNDPSEEGWQRAVARRLDDAIDFIVDASPPKMFKAVPQPKDFGGRPVLIQLAPDRTHILSAIETINRHGDSLILDRNARDVRRLVRAERSRLGLIIGMAILMSTLLSLFLARTIVRPIRRLARAAVRVRMGRAREVTVPRLPSRRDELGHLARALSDMSLALRARIDASEAFAADVTHELKNPLASLRSAIEGFGKVKDPMLQKQLLGVMDEDVHRLDRLITDIADLSRLDAQLTRVRFTRIDLGPVVERHLKAREARNIDGAITFAYARPLKNTAVLMGEESRILRVIDCLIDNAVSFSPPKGVVRVGVARANEDVLITVEDEGPGIPEDQRDAIFERFHSYRPEAHEFGKHSGLGLAIARTIIVGHDGIIQVLDGASGRGARFEVRLPALLDPA